MKTKAYGAFIALALMVATVSCTDDKEQPYVPSQGEEVNFGATLSTPKSRTYYGDAITDGNGNRIFPIYWNDLNKGYDEIFIYAPDAVQGRNQGYYTVKPTELNQTTPAAVVKNGEIGIQWADKPTDFYSFYPGNAEFNVSAEGTQIKATMPGNQAVTYTEDLAIAAVGDKKTFEAQPDMSCCMMVAKTPSVSPTSEAISLQFNPLSSVIDVTVNGPDETNTTTDGVVRVTSVAVTANAQISGEFAYDYSTDNVICNSTAEADKTIIVSTLGKDTEGDLVGVPLRTDQKLNVKLFVIPNPAVTELTVSVITSDSQVWRKKLNMAHFQPRQIHPVALPQLIAKEAEFDYRTWLSQLDPRIYISELSLPGAALSFNTSDYVNPQVGNRPYYITQTGNIDDQFNAGCRVFQAHIWLVPEESSLDGQTGRFALTTSNGYDTGQRLVPTLRALRAQMEGVHSNGFCIVLLSDYRINGSTYTIQDVYDRLAVLTNSMEDVGILPESEIGPNTTIADVRGKIILKFQLNGSALGEGTRSTLDKIKGWSAVNGSKALFNWWNSTAGSSVFYAPMAFGSVGSFDYRMWLGRPQITSYESGLAYDAAYSYINENNTDCPQRSKADMATGMWLMYSEQAAAGKNYSTCLSNITNVVNSINDTYDPETHNKFYMTYCGGVANGSHSIDNIADAFNAQWTSSVKAIDKKPYGWVLFNKVVAGASTKECIKQVISNNNDINFKLKRNRNAVVEKTRPTGDIQGANPGGTLF